MKTERFEAILAKNEIARELYHVMQTGDPIRASFVLVQLQTIEHYLGDAGQPTIAEIFITNGKTGERS